MLTCTHQGHHSQSNHLKVEETHSDKTMLAFYPNGAGMHTIWLNAESVLVLARKLEAWAIKRGANLPKSSVEGSL